MKNLNYQKGISLIIAVILLAVILIGGGAYYFKQQQAKKSPTVMNTISLSSGPNNYFRAQLIAPSDYFATDDSMIEDYSSQGGMAPPRLILMKNHQVFSNSYYRNITTNASNECIIIFSTMSMGSHALDAWNTNITQFNGQLTDKEVLAIGGRNAQIYKMVRKEGNIYVGLLEIGDKNDTSYYFHTCNTNNKTDFINVIKSMKFRGDIKF